MRCAPGILAAWRVESSDLLAGTACPCVGPFPYHLKERTDADPRRATGVAVDGAVDLPGRRVHRAHAAAAARVRCPPGALPRPRRRLRQLVRWPVRGPATRHLPRAAGGRLAGAVVAAAPAARRPRRAGRTFRGLAPLDARTPPCRSRRGRARPRARLGDGLRRHLGPSSRASPSTAPAAAVISPRH